MLLGAYDLINFTLYCNKRKVKYADIQQKKGLKNKFGKTLKNRQIHPKLDLVNVVVRPLLFTKSSLFT